jgi:hypothetical protein
MNWFKKISQTYTPEQIIEGVLNNTIDGSSPSMNLPQGGFAYQQMKLIGAQACDAINYAAGVNPAAQKKMKVLSDAAGCQWNPAPVQPAQPVPGMPQQLPQLGEQGRPMDNPEVEVV